MIRAATREEILRVAPCMGYDPSSECKGVLYNDEAIALYDHWTHNSANVHIWARSPRPLFDKSFRHEMFSYPFCQVDKELLITITPADHLPSLAISKSLGFRETYRFRNGWDKGVDLIVKEFTRDEWLAQQQRAA